MSASPPISAKMMEEEEWIMDLTEELKLHRTSPPDHELSIKSIYRVPKILTDVNDLAYKPKLVSLGPFHYDAPPHLRQMEERKHRALIQFLLRIAKSGQTPQDVLSAMRKIEPSLRASYDSLPLNYEDAFLKLMILDGCFVLEVMLADMRSAAGEKSEYGSREPVFGAVTKDYVVPILQRDMLLLENQLPFLALTTLADIHGLGIGDVNALIKAFYNISSNESEITLIKPFYNISLNEDEIIDQGLKVPTEQNFHILDLYRKMLIAKGEYLPSSEPNVRSAIELKNAGVSFRKSNSCSYRDISFKDGILSLPLLFIVDDTESVLLNLMAFERCHVTVRKEVTAYVSFMDDLINTVDDVALLRNEGIIIGWVGCDENIVKMFNEITKEMIILPSKDDIQVDVDRNLNSYCKKRMHRWRASFVQTYLKNPWVFTSLLGGLFLLALTIIQTVYSMLQYYHSEF